MLSNAFLAGLPGLPRAALSLSPASRPAGTTYSKPNTGTSPFFTHGFLEDQSYSDPFYDANGIFKTAGATLNFVMHGDSITNGATASESYAPKLIRALGLAGVKANYKQRGVSGQGFNYVYSVPANPNSLIAEAAAQVDACISGSLTNYLVIWAGTNDAVLGLSTPAQIKTYSETYLDARLLAGFPAANIAVVDMAPRQTFSEVTRAAINANFATSAAARGCKLVTVSANAFIGAAGQQNDTTYFTDTVHLTDAGQLIAMNLIKTALGL